MEHIHAILLKDELLSKVILQVELPALQPGNLYHSLMESIVSQQLSVKVADIIWARFLQLFEEGVPHPAMVLELPIEQMRAVGLSNQKASYLKNVAQFFRDNDLENKDWSNLSDEEIITYLTQIKGVGRWTVQMILMFTLARLDVFPVLDLGIQQGMKRLYSLEQEGKDLHKTMHEIAEQWRPFRSLASRYIWKWKDLKLK